MCILSVVSAQEYTTKYDNVDYIEIFKSESLFNKYYKCLLDEGKCTPEGEELKLTLPDALQTNCSKCTGTRRDEVERAIRYFVDLKPKEWIPLQQKYDPQNLYPARFLKQFGSMNVRTSPQ